MTDTWKKWNIYTSIHLFECCVYSWRAHIHGFENEERMRNLFWHYLNYGNCNTYYD